MTLIPVDLTHIQQVVLSDAQQLKATLSWIRERNSAYSHQMTVANMNAAAIGVGDQNAILNLAYDFARLEDFMTGTLPGVAADVRVDIANVIGVL